MMHRNNETPKRTYHPFISLKNLDKTAVVWVNSPVNCALAQSRRHIWNSASIRCCTDGAANIIMEFCKRKEFLLPNLIAGDFDSITHEAREYFSELDDSTLVHLSDQNTTDLTKVLRLLTSKIQEEQTEIQNIILLGGLNGRFDHIFGALNAVLLQLTNVPHLQLFFIDGENVVTIITEGITEIELDPKQITGICGLLPFCQRETIVQTSGFRWNLDNVPLQFGGIVSSSNEVMDAKNLVVETTAPMVFSFQLLNSISSI